MGLFVMLNKSSNSSVAKKVIACWKKYFGLKVKEYSYKHHTTPPYLNWESKNVIPDMTILQESGFLLVAKLY